jgi:hypothetical protein
MEQTPSPNQSNLDRQAVSNISRLVRGGLMPAKDLPALKLAMIRHSKLGDIAKLPKNQRDILQRYNSALSGAALGSNQSISAVYRNVRKEDYEISREEYISEDINSDPPVIIVLKRKGIRIFPDGKRVALYNNDKLGLTFTIPYSTSKGIENPMVGVTEEMENVLENIEQIKNIVSSKKNKELKFADGSTMNVDHTTATAIHNVHNALNDENKTKFARMLGHSKEQFSKAANFSLKQHKFVINK